MGTNYTSPVIIFLTTLTKLPHLYFIKVLEFTTEKCFFFISAICFFFEKINYKIDQIVIKTFI